MQRQRLLGIPRILFSGVLMLTVVFSQADYLAGEAAHSATQTTNVCRGFVVLPNGFAVLSGIPAVPERTPARTVHSHAQSGSAMAGKGHTHVATAVQSSGAPAHLLDYQHGQDISPQEGMLCVPINGQDAAAWTAVSADPALVVNTASLRGALTHNSRTNEALVFTISRDGVPVGQAQVRLLARMPHHDHRLPGGHGPANDPDVQGLTAQPDGSGHYTVSTVDFTMAGPWLLEMQVQEGSASHRAFLGVAVGED